MIQSYLYLREQVKVEKQVSLKGLFFTEGDLKTKRHNNHICNYYLDNKHDVIIRPLCLHISYGKSQVTCIISCLISKSDLQEYYRGSSIIGTSITLILAILGLIKQSDAKNNRRYDDLKWNGNICSATHTLTVS